ncbi:hypothetical protein ABFS82_09G037300 [Erythranthe guttata]
MKLSADKNTSLLHGEENHHEKLSKFRARNKTIILVSTAFFITLTLIITALIFHLVRNIRSQQSDPYTIHLLPVSQLQSFHPCNMTSCSGTNYSDLPEPAVTDPNRVFILSLQAAAVQLQNITSSLTTTTTSSSFNNCSVSLRHRSGQIREVLDTMRVDPFVGRLSMEQRFEIMKRISVAKENLMSCVRGMGEMESTAEIEEVRAEVLRVIVYLRSSGENLVRYRKFVREFHSDVAGDYWRNMISDNMFIISMCGLQLVFIFFLYWTLFRFG